MENGAKNLFPVAKEAQNIAKFSFGFVVVAIVVFVGIAVCKPADGNPERPPSFDLLEELIYVNASESTVCNEDLRGWTLLDLATINVITKAENATDYFEDILEGINNSNYSLKDTYNGSHMYGYHVTKTENGITYDALFLSGSPSDLHNGFIMENVVFGWTRVIADIFRLGSTIYSHLMAYIHLFCVGVYSCFIGAHTISYEYEKDIRSIWESYIKSIGEDRAKKSIFVGHSSGGLAAKYLSLTHDVESVAFQSPQISMSTISTMSVDSPWNFVQYANQMDKDKRLMHNYFSKGLFLYGVSEDDTLSDIRLPTINSLSFTNVSQTFCIIAAGCTLDNAFEDFCNNTDANYSYILGHWHRL